MAKKKEKNKTIEPVEEDANQPAQSMSSVTPVEETPPEEKVIELKLRTLDERVNRLESEQARLVQILTKQRIIPARNSLRMKMGMGM